MHVSNVPVASSEKKVIHILGSEALFMNLVNMFHSREDLKNRAFL